MARLENDRLKEEVIHYVLSCVVRYEEVARELKARLRFHEPPSAHLLREAVVASIRLSLVASHLPTGKAALGRLTPRDLRRGMVAVLEHCSSSLMSQACGADNSGGMNSTDAMHRTYAAIEMSQHAQFVREWTTKL